MPIKTPLLGATEFELAVRLWKVSRTECLIFFGAFFGVLLLGTALFQIPEMTVSGLYAKKTPRRFCRTDNHLGKGKHDADQNTIAWSHGI